MTQEPGQLVRSPEQVALFLPVAGPTTRILAYAIDAAVLLTVQIAILIGLLFGLPALFQTLFEPFANWLRNTGGSPKEPISGAIMLIVAVIYALQFVVELGYFVFAEWVTGGQSIGKRLLGLRVVQDGGFPLETRQSIVRNLLRAVDSLPWSYVVGLVAVIVSRDGKRLGDLAAGTVVVRLDRPARPAPLPWVQSAVLDTFTFDRAQLARIGPTEVTLAIETLRRLDSLDAELAADALARATGALATRMGHRPLEPHERAAFLRALLDAVGLDRSPRTDAAAEGVDGAIDFAFDPVQIARIRQTEVTLAIEMLQRLPSLGPLQAEHDLERAASAIARQMGYRPLAPDERAAFLRAVLDAAGLE
jgi:uncharacterized RDD family membrane protein YckC